MISGTIILEDTSITFVIDPQHNTATYTVCDTFAGLTEHFTVPQAHFLAALSIAIHNDGQTDYDKDLILAESIMGEIRWIP
jgi:hypothetical protein